MVYSLQSKEAVHAHSQLYRESSRQRQACEDANPPEPRLSRADGLVCFQPHAHGRAAHLLPAFAIKARKSERSHAGIPSLRQRQDQIHATLKVAPPEFKR